MDKKIININIGKKTIIYNKNDIPIYDMYYVTLAYDNKETKTIKAFTYPDTINETINHEVINGFFQRLPNLIKKQGRKDYIFLGRLELTGSTYIADRFYRLPSGEIAQAKFDIDYLKIKDALESINTKTEDTTNYAPSPSHSLKSPANSQKGKNYVISDIHGYYGSYLDALNMLSPQDTLFILGDVIDRGNNGIAILQDIISRKKASQNPKIIFLLGNHEWQMLQCLDLIDKYNLSPAEISTYCEAGKWIRNIMEDEVALHTLQKSNQDIDQLELYIKKKTIQEYKQKKSDALSQLVSPKNLTDEEMELLSRWLFANEGDLTYNQYILLTKQEQQDIYQFLMNSLLLAKIEINDKKFCLIHATPPNSQEYIDLVENEPQIGFAYSSVVNLRSYEPLVKMCIDTRKTDNYDAFQLWKNSGYTMIIWHTPSKRLYCRKSRYKFHMH